MRYIFRMLKRILAIMVLLGLVLTAPVVWVETTCRGAPVADNYASIISDPAYKREEARTLLTYAEWHIVHAYDDYARVIRDADPHDFAYWRSIKGYWTSLCTMSEMAGAHGGVSGETKQLVYMIGASFTAELSLKALYEETIGGMAAGIRGPRRAKLDVLSAEHATRYAAFLQQVPWYKWDFLGDAAALSAVSTFDAPGFRNRERRLALGLEYRVKAGYANIAAGMVANAGADALTLRMIITDITPAALAGSPDVTTIATRIQGTEIETPRYRKLTGQLDRWAKAGANFVEIAGNDDIMLSVLSDAPQLDAILSYRRQGYGDYRGLLLVKVSDLADILRGMEQRGARLEHIHDY